MKSHKAELRRVIRGKQERRKALARLPIEKKVAILIQLQQMASPVLQARGLKRAPWNIN